MIAFTTSRPLTDSFFGKPRFANTYRFCSAAHFRSYVFLSAILLPVTLSSACLGEEVRAHPLAENKVTLKMTYGLHDTNEIWIKNNLPSGLAELKMSVFGESVITPEIVDFICSHSDIVRLSFGGKCINDRHLKELGKLRR